MSLCKSTKKHFSNTTESRGGVRKIILKNNIQIGMQDFKIKSRILFQSFTLVDCTIHGTERKFENCNSIHQSQIKYLDSGEK